MPTQSSDLLHRYLFESLSVRGQLVQLNDTYQQLLTSQDYPPAVAHLLGELLVASSLLTATIKFEGSITLQLQGKGPVSLVVINGDHQQQMRGVARWQGELDDNADLHTLLGEGFLVITIEPVKGERYQGVVALEGDNLSQVLEQYFLRSEQLKTRLWLRTEQKNDQAQAAGMLLQVIPDGTGSPQDFEHLEQLTDTIKNEELFTLDANTLLYRLYNQEQVRLFDPQPVRFVCGCSPEKSAAAIKSLPKTERDEILQEEGHIALHCDYCGTTYRFTAEQLESVLPADSVHSPRLH